jgi:hypothetical protein
MKCCRLYVCTRTDHDESNSDDDEAISAAVAARFESFTMTRATGWFRGRREPVCIVMVATDDEAAVVELARQLRQAMDQEGVGVQCDGTYRRITANI